MEESASEAEAAQLETASLREALVETTGRLEEAEKDLADTAAGAQDLEMALREAGDRGHAFEERLAQQVDTVLVVYILSFFVYW